MSAGECDVAGATVHAIDGDGEIVFQLHHNGCTWRGRAPHECVVDKVVVGGAASERRVRLDRTCRMLEGDTIDVSGLVVTVSVAPGHMRIFLDEGALLRAVTPRASAATAR